MVTIFQRNQFSTFSFYPNFVSVNAGHSPADFIDAGLPAEDLRQTEQYALPLSTPSLVPGLYLLHLTNSKGRIFNLKFVVE